MYIRKVHYSPEANLKSVRLRSEGLRPCCFAGRVVPTFLPKVPPQSSRFLGTYTWFFTGQKLKKWPKVWSPYPGKCLWLYHNTACRPV